MDRLFKHKTARKTKQKENATRGNEMKDETKKKKTKNKIDETKDSKTFTHPFEMK